ncbi:putative helicase mov-10-B.1 [Sinocyclocheilus grahami]|nr:PREDICTED: putative helicase mov-10-B.1 [Sinocyclocheilus grahami]
MVGNPIILQTDATWGRFIHYCIEKGGYTGYDISNLEETEAVVERLLALNIHEETIVKTEESVVQQYLNPEWRHDH